MEKALQREEHVEVVGSTDTLRGSAKTLANANGAPPALTNALPQAALAAAAEEKAALLQVGGAADLAARAARGEQERAAAQARALELERRLQVPS